MAGSRLRTALVISTAVYLLFTAFVFWNEGGFVLGKKEIVDVHASPTERKIFIPKMGVEAKVLTVGTMPNGSIGTPPNATDVAWFAGSSPIGRAGTAVIVGHVDTRVFGPGVFRGLKGLVKGDTIYTSIDGHKGQYTVTGLEVYPEGTDRMDEIIGVKEGKSRLVLITCDGKWNQAVKRYTERLVVFADLVN